MNRQQQSQLAWERTAIAVMAFGFLFEKFDLFLEVAALPLGERAPTALNTLVGYVSGLLPILLGGAMMVVATLRGRQVGRDIDAAEPRLDPWHPDGHGTRRPPARSQRHTIRLPLIQSIPASLVNPKDPHRLSGRAGRCSLFAKWGWITPAAH